MGLQNGISFGIRNKHIRIWNKFDWVEGVIDHSGDPTGGTPSRSVTIYAKNVYLMFNQETESPFQTLGA